MTQTLLRIDASARHENSTTRALADRVAAKLQPSKTLTRDLSKETIPQLDAGWLHAAFTADESRTEEQRARLALSEELIDEVRAADTLLISTPIYNFAAPASLKAWMDMVARAGITFRYTETGPEGLLTGKRAILVIASGGTEVDSAIDFATPWLRHMLGFIGITDVQVVRSDLQSLDADASQARAEQDLARVA
ncbi:FMN-dependent NADH-azoreductase [Sagittula salina]|uniref:FMN dependent NADH:quinone oxidoreductase n=1 Tax=Sagittula salina TaxID=2820268 RepID=A0A940MMC8_9RHOB|nr:NAD(P)H-dependent oxidoreductase [Sagittula salina]MBP0482370.1 NAD(P)H-dependent oxidoreductase [Sagittula salina]